MTFFDVSLSTANEFYTWGWRLSLSGAIVTAIGVCILMWGTFVRDHYSEEQIATLNASAAASKERAAIIELKANQVQLDLEKEKLARVKIESQMAPRTIKQDQQHELTAKLLEYKNQRVALIASPSTPESEWFARVLGAPLKKAGWEIEILPGTAGATVLFPKGVVVQFAQHPNDAIAATRLAEALNELGIEATALPGLPDQAPYTIKVVISTK